MGTISVRRIHGTIKDIKVHTFLVERGVKEGLGGRVGSQGKTKTLKEGQKVHRGVQCNKTGVTKR